MRADLGWVGMVVVVVFWGEFGWWVFGGREEERRGRAWKRVRKVTSAFSEVR